MFRHIVILSLAIVVLIAALPAMSQEDAEGALKRAQALYYEARFKDSVDLLLPVDAMLRQQPSRVGLNISVKLQLALGYIGQNQNTEAKSVFQEVCLMDPEFALDASQFSPKVLDLFEDARKDQKKLRCDARCREIDRLTRNGDVPGLLVLTREPAAGCTCGASTDAAQLLFRQGVDAYKRENFAQALERFRAALKLQPEHELAGQYTELAEGKTKLTVDRLLLDWRKQFDARQFAEATKAYKQLASSNVEGRANAALEQIGGEYRKVVASQLESWNNNCAAGGALSVDSARQQAGEILPDQSIAADLIATFVPCARKPEPAAAPVVARQGCLQMPSQLAMVRVKSRVNPDILPNRLPLNPVNISVKIRIDESGNVAVQKVDGPDPYINEMMRVAVEKWKFLPAISQEEARCVETEIPIRLARG